MAEDVCALPLGAMENSSGDGRSCDEIAGQSNDVGIHAVDAVDSLAKQERLSKFIEMDIAELRYAEAVKSVRKAGNQYVATRDFDPMTFDLAGIESEASGCARRGGQEASPRDRRPG